MIYVDNSDFRYYTYDVRNSEREVYRIAMKCSKRYCLEKLSSYDPKCKLETWNKTKISSEDITGLAMFLGEGYRIFDTVANREILRNVDLTRW